MSLEMIIILGVVALFVAIALEAFLRRNRPRKTLVEKFKPGANDPETGKTPLGMEATDMQVIRNSEAGSNHPDKRHKIQVGWTPRN